MILFFNDQLFEKLMERWGTLRVSNWDMGRFQDFYKRNTRSMGQWKVNVKKGNNMSSIVTRAILRKRKVGDLVAGRILSGRVPTDYCVPIDCLPAARDARTVCALLVSSVASKIPPGANTRAGF